ncbi:hypothetical protein DKT77_10515 [Meridianimarinicoccus roseus]|jgi:hypothetical protein|uniref:Uncharacterized protein n=1 Tax=Meridianimarinicoccus roseus TaxID=2072018 RepID=A0A2V2LFE2_9RHOB|nr:hypothetical protein [Meridianimarinicoccus roseus]PWR02611.1 hypothetical protein DKT77_10515 [Meridianimarinicoccus roseus]
MHDDLPDTPNPSLLSPVALVAMDGALTLALVWIFKSWALSWGAALLLGWICGAFLTVGIMFAAAVASEQTTDNDA